MFDVEGFKQTTFKPRESKMTLEAFKEAGFGDGVLIVRGLTAFEIAKADEASQKNNLTSDLFEKLAGGVSKEKVSALLEGIGISDDVPSLLAKRYEHVVMGVIKPKFELDDVVKLGDTFPIEFSQIANQILKLTGLGKQAEVKPPPSGS